MAMERFELSEGWEWKPLRSVVLSKEIWSPAKKPRESFKYIEISSVDNKTGTIIKTKRIDGKNPPSRAKKIVRGNDVIFGTTRPYLKNIALIPEHLDNQICSTGFCVLRADIEQVIPEWIFLASRSDIVIDQVIPGQDKSAYPAVSDDEVLDALIPLPPIDEQRRIVARIEELTKRVEEARKLRREAVSEINNIVNAGMKTCFDNGDTFIEKPIGKLCTMKTGKTPPTSNKEYFDGDIPFVCPADVGERMEVSTAMRSLTRKAVEEKKATLFQCGTVLLVSIGSTVGKIGIATKNLCTNQQITGLHFGSEVLPEHAAWYLSWQKETIRTSAAGGGVPIINQNGIGQLTLKYPEDKSEQQRIVDYLAGLQSKVDELKHLQLETETKLDKFTPALLAKAFRGEL